MSKKTQNLSNRLIAKFLGTVSINDVLNNNTLQVLFQHI